MLRFRAFCFCLLIFPTIAVAQEAQEQSLTIQESGKAYLDAIGRRSVDADVVYFDPTRPPPELNTNQDPQRARETSDGVTGFDLGLSSRENTILNVLAVAILVGIGWLVFKNGGRFSVSFRGDAKNVARAGRPGTRHAPELDSTPSDLSSILKIKDRRDALIALAQGALVRSVTAQGMLIQKSWTARDAMHRLPAEMKHKDVLGDLVAAAEKVNFGGRDVSQEMFEDFVARIRPLFAEGPK